MSNKIYLENIPVSAGLTRNTLRQGHLTSGPSKRTGEKLRGVKLLLAVVLLALTSCDYLDITPDNMATIDYAFADRYSALRYLYTCYSYRPPVGDLDGDPAMGGCDETWQRVNTLAFDIYRTFAPSHIARAEQNVSSPYLNFWDGYLWVGIRDCNIFLERIPDVVVDMIETERARWIAEAKFLKAYYHFFLLQAYGPIPIMDVNMPISASVDEVKVYREPIDDVVEYIVGLLDEAIVDLPTASAILEGTEAGRADQLIAATLRAYVRLWAASPLVNGENTAFQTVKDNRGRYLFPQGEPDLHKWELAAQAADSAIALCERQGKSLYKQVENHTVTAEPIFQLQSVLRRVICDRWNCELIWGGTNYSNATLTRYVSTRLLRRESMNSLFPEWAPTLKMVEKFYSANGVPINEDNDWVNQGWYADRYKLHDPSDPNTDDKYIVRQNEVTVNLHYNREPRFYADIAFDKGIYFGNGHYDFSDGSLFYCDFLNLGYSGYQGGSGYSITGYGCKKLHNYTNTQTSDTESNEYFPFPIFRLAELYLMYAEAVNEAEGPNGPNSAKMFARIDSVRLRAGLEGVKKSWSEHSIRATKFESQAGMRDIIRQERTIELMFEGKRFWDLRRWNLITELNSQPQGWYIRGETPEDFYKVTNAYPQYISFSTKDYFWPIRESDLYVNDNLVQNYGW
ncbi:MAG: RagB/SusD family nutrient uptake outer membrane protein [Bacteroidales bacterium]|jgi:hypothetical protein|nr:RagB/SusD family nutrient uptake outer membrane protein [Bacteroidales bacterium]